MSNKIKLQSTLNENEVIIVASKKEADANIALGYWKEVVKDDRQREDKRTHTSKKE